MLIRISKRHSNLSFAQNFVIYWLFQNGASKNQHQESYQRETLPYKFVFFFKIGKAKKVNNVSKIHVCMWVRYMCWRNFCNFSLVTKNLKSRSKIALFSNERHLKFDFQKQLRFSDVNYLNYTKKRPNFACENYIFPKTSGPIRHSLNMFICQYQLSFLPGWGEEQYCSSIWVNILRHLVGRNEI